MTTTEQDEFTKKWVAALRSGEYEQCTGSLHNGKGFCCLGVGAQLALGSPAAVQTEGYSAIKEAAGLRDEMGFYDENALYKLNDHLGMTFNEIADVIESRPPGLFVE